MVRVLSRAPPLAAMEIASPDGLAGSQMGRTRFAQAWKRWYPDKTEEELASRAHIGVGTAKHYLRGTRKISARALDATVRELMSDQAGAD